MNWRKVAVLIVALLITAILGWLSNPKVAETRLESADYWPYNFHENIIPGGLSGEVSPMTSWEALESGFLFPKNVTGRGETHGGVVKSEVSDQGREVPPAPQILGAAFKDGKLSLYVLEEGKGVSYSVGDEVLSGWTIDYADLDIMHLRFDNIGLVVDILTSQVE